MVEAETHEITLQLREKNLYQSIIYLTSVRFYDTLSIVANGEVRMEQTLRCDQCGTEFTPKTFWARFCSLRCRNAWWRHQYKLAQAEAGEVNGHGTVSGTAIVEAIRSAVAPVAAENGMRRRAL